MAEAHQKVLNEILNYIRPKQEDKKRLNDLTKRTLEIASEHMKKFGGDAILAGSITRDTWLPDKMEFDIFIIFPTSFSKKQLENFGLEIGKDIIQTLKGGYKIEYAEHPYVSGNVEGIRIDIVPCFKVKSTAKLKSAVDRTPLHVKYIEKNLRPPFSNEVRLLKKFCKANGMYGADAKTEGFSGYVCELLIINYGKFIDVLKSAVFWIPRKVIDIENYYSIEDHPKLRKKFKGQVLILIDPTDKKRNAGAAISSQNFFKFKKLAKGFLKKASGEFFFEKKYEPINENELVQNQLKRRTELILVNFNPPQVVPDILWPQLRKFAERLQSILEEVKYEFKVLRKDVYTNEKDLAVVLLEMEVSKLPMIQKRIGPEVFDMDDSERFIQKYKGQTITGPFVENNFWCVEINRTFLSAREKLIDSLNKSVDILKAKGIPNHIAEQIVKYFDVFSANEKIMRLIEKDRKFGIFLRKYFEKESLV